MKGLRGVGNALRAVFQPQPGLPAQPKSRNLSEAIDRLNRETQSLISEVHGPRTTAELLDDLARRR